MYDMYPWNEPGSEAGHDREQNASAWLPAPRDGARHGNGTDVPAEFTQAVQFALDRRDNGGDAAALPAPQPGPQPAPQPGPLPAPRPATPPAASLTRQ